MPDTMDEKERLREKVAAEHGFQFYRRYSERQAAETIGWDYSTLKRKRRAGLVPFVDLGGGSVGYMGYHIADIILFGVKAKENLEGEQCEQRDQRMPRYSKRDYQVGDWWLGQRDGSAAYYGIRYNASKQSNERVSLGTSELEVAKQKLTELHLQTRTSQDRRSRKRLRSPTCCAATGSSTAPRCAAPRATAIASTYGSTTGRTRMVSDLSVKRQEEFHTVDAGAWLHARRHDARLEHRQGGAEPRARRGELAQLPHIS